MATTSMHKPGWRSRRRSRLSLVERAVPRLGPLQPSEEDELDAVSLAEALPDEAAAAEPSKGDGPPSHALMDPLRPSSAAETTADVPATPVDGPDLADEDSQKPDDDNTVIQSAAKADDVASAGHTDVASEDDIAESDDVAIGVDTVGADAAAMDDVVAGRDIAADGDDAAAKDDANLADDIVGEIETSGDVENAKQNIDVLRQPSGHVASVEASARESSVDGPIVDEPPHGDETSSGEAGTSVFGPPTVDAVSSPLVMAATQVMGPVAPSPDESPEQSPDQSTNQSDEASKDRLELDWDRLIDCGFADPRDRNQPLPGNMDPIIRALLRQALSDQSSWRDRIILVTSPNERSSKSAAAIHFAFGLTTIKNHHAVLVDVDSTDIGAVDHLGGHDRIGITEALPDESLKVDDLVISTDLDRLTLVASGASDGDLIDRLASRRMLQILRHLTKSPETILVIDAPPILVSQEAAVLSVIAGQVVLAVEAGKTTGDQIEHALQRLGDRHNVSLVLNESNVYRQQPSRLGRKPNQAPSTNRRTPEGRGPLPKVAAAMVSALAFGLFVQQFQAEAAFDHDKNTDFVTLTEGDTAKKIVVEPERWSKEVALTTSLCRQMCP